jgi:hypothetical protein
MVLMVVPDGEFSGGICSSRGKEKEEERRRRPMVRILRDRKFTVPMKMIGERW